MDFLTGKLLYTCCPVPDLFGDWVVFLFDLLMKFKSALLNTLNNIEGLLSIVTPVRVSQILYLHGGDCLPSVRGDREQVMRGDR